MHSRGCRDFRRSTNRSNQNLEVLERAFPKGHQSFATLVCFMDPSIARQMSDDLPIHMNDGQVSWQRKEEFPWLLFDDRFIVGNNTVRIPVV